MKKIIYRYRTTGKISHDQNYADYLQMFRSEEQIAEIINAYNKDGKILCAEIVELDDIAEFYAKRAENHLNMPADIEERLREIASEITDIADEIETEKRRIK